jgi:hypothetical protein
MAHHREILEHVEWFSGCLELRACFLSREAPSPELAARLADTSEACRARREADPECASNVLATAFALTTTQLEILWLCVALATDEAAQRWAERLGIGTTDVRIDAARQLIYGTELRLDALNELCEHASLFKLGLLERTDSLGPSAPFPKQSWGCSRRLLAWLLGDRTCDRALSRIASVAAQSLSLDTLCMHADAIDAARTAFARDGLVLVSGAPGLGRRSLLQAAAREAGVEILDIDARRLSTDPETLTRELRLLARECKLLARAPLVHNIDALVDNGNSTRLQVVDTELFDEVHGIVLATCGERHPAIRWNRSCIVVAVKPPASHQRARFWRQCLGQGTDDDAQFLATRYPLAPSLIHAAGAAIASRVSGRAIEADDVYTAIRSVLDDRLGDYARRVEVTQTWTDLVLPPDQLSAIQYLIARIRQRRTVYEDWGYAAKVGKGLGTSALFSGPPGTGKTMVAALVARELGLELYQVTFRTSCPNGLVRRSATSPPCLTLLRPDTRSCYSTRPMPFSASEPRSSRATIAMRTSRRTTCYSASRRSPASASSRRTTRRISILRFCADCPCICASTFRT